MTIYELYEEAKREQCVTLWALIEFLIFEKGKESKLTFASSAKEIEFYYQDRFRDKMNTYLTEYMRRRGIQIPPYDEKEHQRSLQELEKVNALIAIFEALQNEKQSEVVFA